MQIPASGSAVDTYLNETQNTDLPAVVNPAQRAALQARDALLVAASGHGVARLSSS